MPKKYFKVFENRAKLRSSDQMYEFQTKLEALIREAAEQVHPRDIFALEAMCVHSVGLAVATARIDLGLRTHLQKKKKRKG